MMIDFAFDDDNTMNRGLQQIKKLFRITEVFGALSLLTWTLTRLPFAVRISGEYLRHLVNIVVSHLFVFFLTNAIVLILFLKSRSLFLHHDMQDDSEMNVDFFEGIITGNGGEEEIVYQDKQTILEVRVHRRNQSENFRREKSAGFEKQLRRSETEKQRRVEEEAAAEMVDGLSNEEFQRIIEAFIAKQVKFHKEEKLAIVLHECR